MAQQIRAEETRSRILEAAQNCFSRKGYDAASVSDICREAGITKGAFYYHFETKQALFLELLKFWLNQLDVQFLIAHDEARTVSESLIEMAGATRVIFNESAGYLPMFLEFWLHSIRDPVIWQTVIEPYRHYILLFTRLMEEGKTDGSILIDNPLLASRTLTALAIGMILQGLIDPQGANWGKETQDSIKLLLQGLNPR